MEIVAARAHLAKRLKDDIGWWYNQARRIVDEPRGKLDDNAAKIVLAVFDKLLPSLKEVSKDDAGGAQPPVVLVVQGVQRGQAATRPAVEAEFVEVEAADAPG